MRLVIVVKSARAGMFSTKPFMVVEELVGYFSLLTDGGLWDRVTL
jgi:hypothetical protein